MRYFFFVTSHQVRTPGGSPEPTMRALPNQTFDDGTPVNSDTINVSGPKEPGSSANGSRRDYPDGTIFCSTFLKLVQRDNQRPFYTVYNEENGEGSSAGMKDPDFHPVSDDPNFNYVSPSHKSDRMNAAYVLFKNFGTQTDQNDLFNQSAPTAPAAPVTHYEPADGNGKAIGTIAGWTPAYTDQVDTETNLIISWMRKTLNDLSINTMARRPKPSAAVSQKVQELFQCGEDADTICSRGRFNKKMTQQGIDYQGLTIISKGPLEWYLDELIAEHQTGADCSAVRRSADNDTDVNDTAFIITTEINNQLGTTENSNNPQLTGDIKKALEMGWRLKDILVPDLLTSKGSASALASALASGAIPLNVSNPAGASFIDNLLSQDRNRRPTAKDGFYVSPKDWKLLINNLYDRVNTIIIGPTGSGKTELIMRMCEQTGTPLTIVQMGAITDPTEQLIGKMNLEAGPTGPATEFDWAPFALAIQKPGVVILDEINRIPRNGTNILFNVLDGIRTLSAPGAKGTDKREITVHPDCVFFATANVGSAYTGTSEIDAALLNRFMPMLLDYLSVKEETEVLINRWKIDRKDAENIALVAADIRRSKRDSKIEHEVSTRETLTCARLVNRGFDAEESMEYVFLPRFEPGRSENDKTSEQYQVKALIASRFNTSPGN